MGFFVIPADDDTEAYKQAVKDMEHEHYGLLIDEISDTVDELEEQHDALRQLDILLPLCKAIPPGVLSAFTILHGTSKTVGKKLTACLKHRPEIWKPSARSAQLAQQVFGVPELCEQIIGHLAELQDVISATMMSRATMATARASRKILQALGLAVNEGEHWSTSFGSGQHRGFGCIMFEVGEDWSTAPAPELNTPELPTIYAGFSSRRRYGGLPRVGRAYLAVPICWPPLREMQPTLSCCGHWRGHNDEPATAGEVSVGNVPPPVPVKPITTPGGLTLGDLYNATRRLQEEHRLCPYGDVEHMDRDGMLKIDVHFKASLRLAEDDPMLAVRREAVEADDQLNKERDRSRQYHTAQRTERELLLKQYTQAKMAALMSQKKIPTLAEYAADKERIDAEVAEEANRIAKLSVSEQGRWGSSWDASDGSGW
ncbi:hypothetical protein LTR27_009014 [Elasticomyces elasticus]|nr:hypothetical protein LTR27_009014 [Elasticomyces elasticus]